MAGRIVHRKSLRSTTGPTKRWDCPHKAVIYSSTRSTRPETSCMSTNCLSRPFFPPPYCSNIVLSLCCQLCCGEAVSNAKPLLCLYLQAFCTSILTVVIVYFSGCDWALWPFFLLPSRCLCLSVSLFSSLLCCAPGVNSSDLLTN